MEITKRENLHQVDLISPAPVKITEREYWKNRREQEKLDELNSQIVADGMKPRFTNYQTQKQFIRDAVTDIAAQTCSFDAFKTALFAKYGITVKSSRGRFSYLHPEREKYITARKLGAAFEQDYLLSIFAENEKAGRQQPAKPEVSPDKEITEADHFLPKVPPKDYDPSYDYHADPIAILYIRSNLRLVVDLQTNIKAQQSEAYARKIRISNLQEMARTVCYVQEHGYASRDDLNKAYESVISKLSDARKTLRSTEDRLKRLNEQIHYVGIYYANKSSMAAFLQSPNKGKYRKEHLSELEAYDASVKYIKEHFGGKAPSLKTLKADRTQLLQMKEAQTGTYQYFKDYEKEMHIACSNVDAILGKARGKDLSKSKERGAF